MEPYDFIFLALLAVSCIAGVVRGATKEVVNLISFFLALFLAIVSHDFITATFHFDTITGYVAAFVLFLLIYFGIRYLGQNLSERIQKQKALNTFDRVLGFAVGFFRTLVVLGAIHLLFVLVTPKDRLPPSFTHAKVYGLSARCAKMIQAFIPDGIDAADKAVDTGK